MIYNIEWTPEAKITYLATLKDVLDKWGIDIAERFENLTDNLTDRLSNGSHQCPQSKIENLRKCVIHKNVSLIYQVQASNIELLTFVNNRSNHKY